jgi:hypothetical protein
MDTIHGPTVQIAAGTVVYQITLSSGMIVTNPSGFGPDDDYSRIIPTVIVAEGGKILSAPKTKDTIKKASD